MILLTVRDLIRRFDAEPVLNRVAFDVRRGERIGLVGPNGAGKTTLLNILAGRDHPDTGEIERPASLTIGLLEQETHERGDRTLLEEARQGLSHLLHLQQQADELARQIADRAVTHSPHDTDGPRNPSPLASLQRRYDEVMHELQRRRAFTVDHRIDEVLQGLGFAPEDYHRPLSSFSGGQQNRAALARLLLQAPDLLLLDEPTNHLDMAATQWLENYLTGAEQTVLLVSHDRYFLDRVTNRTFELMSGRLTSYPGNFSAYRRQRNERVKVLQRTYEKQQEFIARTEDFIRRNKYGQKHAQAADREKKLQRLETVAPPPQEPQLHVSFGEPTRTGDWVIDAVDVSKGFDQPLFRDVSLRIERGDRLGIVGPNGSGKTTLLKVLIGQLPPDTGKVRHGTGVKIGYFDQQLELLDPQLDAVEAVRPPDDPSVTPGEIRSLLGRFGLSGDIVFQKVGRLSGGEKSRLALARLSAARVNVLVLDEPTNHLDLWACEALEEALRQFAGTLLFVSHDRYFLDRIATRIVVLAEGNWKQYDGNYSDYLAFRDGTAREKTDGSLPATTFTASSAETTEPRRKNGSGANGQEAAATATAASPASRNNRRSGNKTGKTKRKRRFPYRKVSEIEADIAEQESLVENLQRLLADPELHRDGERVKETLQAFEEAQLQLEQLYEHWEEALELN